MKATPLIFNCVFTEHQIEELTNVKNALLDCIVEYNDLSLTYQRLYDVKIMLVLLDLNTIINYKNARGYKFNSYTLTILAIKLSFIIHLLSRISDSRIKSIHQIFSTNYQIISKIIDETYEDSLEFETHG